MTTLENVKTFMMNASNEDLKTIQEFAYEMRQFAGQKKKMMFNVGEEVRVAGNRSGEWVGTIHKISKKNVVVKNHETKVMWTCNPNLVHKIV